MPAKAQDDKQLLPVYLFIGEDKLKRDTLLERMEKRVGQLGDIEFNRNVFEAGEVESPDEIPAACNTVPFFSEKRLVVVKEAEHARKAVLDALADYAAQPLDTTVLVIEGDKLAKNTRLYKTVTREYPKAFIACDMKKKRADIRGLVERMARSHGVTLAPAALEHLVDLVGTDTVALDSELRKLADFSEAHGIAIIETGDVDRLVAKAVAPKPWDVANALSERNLGACLAMLGDITDRTPQATLTICANRIRELLTVKAIERRPGAQPLEKVLGGQEWMYRNHRRYAGKFRERELVRALHKAAECEFKMKNGANPDLCLELWVAGVCSGVWAM